jgi:transposase
MDTNLQPLISSSARGHYRQHSLEFKRALVALSLQPGASVARIARAHGVNANQVFSWRRLYHQGRLGEAALARDDGLLPVVLTPTPAVTSNGDDGVAGTIVLEIGQVRVRIEGRADASVLAQVLDRVLQ